MMQMLHMKKVKNLMHLIKLNEQTEKIEENMKKLKETEKDFAKQRNAWFTFFQDFDKEESELKSCLRNEKQKGGENIELKHKTDNEQASEVKYKSIQSAENK